MEKQEFRKKYFPPGVLDWSITPLQPGSDIE